MKISVIIAAYNAEKYVRATLDSIFSQTFDDYEVVIINDGSTDTTISILSEYAVKNKNCHLITQENGGPSAARNTGLAIASGEYLYFLDADDILEKDALEVMYQRATEQNADVVIAKYDIFNEYTISPVTNLDALVAMDSIEKYDTHILWTFPLWNKLFRRSLVLQEHLVFPPLSYSEDGVFSMHMLLHANKITGLNHTILHYRRNYDFHSTSITASTAPWKLDHFLKAHQIIKNDIIDTIVSDYPQYSSFEEIIKSELKPQRFFHEFQVKELQTLYNQFFVHYWSSSVECRQLILAAFHSKFQEADFATKAELLERNSELYLLSNVHSSEEILKQADLSVCLFGMPEWKDVFCSTLASLLSSNYVPYIILLPEIMKEIIIENNFFRDNMIFIPETDQNTFYKKAALYHNSKYILFAEPDFLYTYNAISIIMKRMKATNADYCSESIYCKNNDTYSPLSYQNSEYTQNNVHELHDVIWANKIFKREFLTPYLLDNAPILCRITEIQKKSHHIFYNHQTILFPNSEEVFLAYLGGVSL